MFTITRRFFLALAGKLPCYELPVERATWQEAEGSLLPTATKKLRPSAQQHIRRWRLPTTRQLLPQSSFR